MLMAASSWRFFLILIWMYLVAFKMCSCILPAKGYVCEKYLHDCEAWRNWWSSTKTSIKWSDHALCTVRTQQSLKMQYTGCTMDWGKHCFITYATRLPGLQMVCKQSLPYIFKAIFIVIITTYFVFINDWIIYKYIFC